MSDDQIGAFKDWAKENSAREKPIVQLPSGEVSISDCAAELFRLIAPTKTMFVRGGVVMVLQRRGDGLLALEILRPAAARSKFEKYARLFAWRSGADRKPVLKHTPLAHDMADALLQTEEARRLLPCVAGLVNCPIIRVVNGQALISGAGYDGETRLLVTGDRQPETVDVKTAASDLLGLLKEFDFQSEGDKSRAVASLISPGLKLGGFIKGRVPADVAEADKSQAGKTYRQRIIAAIYNEQVSLVTRREGGVGSVDESLDHQLIMGRPFIQLDNFRGRFDSPHLEAFLTAEGSFTCRVPHRLGVTVAPENFFIMLTSNGVDTTRDLANRSNIVRIRKQPPGFVFGKFPEGDLLAHVRARQPYYLGCIFAVIRHWHEAGQPRTDEARHDFRDWVQVVDWIVQNLFGLPSAMDGHQEAQERVSNPALGWLRRLALTIEQTGKLAIEFTATDIHSLCESADIAIPGLRDVGDEDKAKRVIGIIMAKMFCESDTLNVDGYQIVRGERCVARDNTSAGGGFKSKTYAVRKG